MKLLLALLGATLVHAQQDSIRAAMQASLDQQRASVQRQVTSAQAASPPGFFTIPWPDAPQVAAVPAQVSSADCEAIGEDELSRLISDAAQREGVKPEIVRAVVRRESAGRPCAVSVKGAQGLMQIMPATAVELGVTDAFDAKQNIDAGTKFLKQLMTRYSGDLKLALSAYNAGPGRVEDKVPDIAETREYVRSILSALKME